MVAVLQLLAGKPMKAGLMEDSGGLLHPIIYTCCMGARELQRGAGKLNPRWA